jgi:hypothetical protein
MTPDDFIAGIRLRVVNATVNGIVSSLEMPVGRRPSERDVDHAKWYAALSEPDRLRAVEIIRDSVTAAIFNFLCVLAAR